ncbi:glucose-6-phosphate dehydrogenase [Buchnera aphidicola (Thelaxes californica)]|uniref:Glucose-6-phosphate 1-dehydrogenase n=1 Tax=Buchnera aphidicola (Thelaxes californica) TaxID=1315998 RepID=A0A4D6YLB8_9GAMM|nr:glucose-6-phosphate dehydrogenase [Buchnera aphidicola]QCI26780.1 glucose-6-phosphate dehydrogenase [Buchnera aphidicola (Thelaxes californica)]
MENQNTQNYCLVIFGAKGDLARRKLLPALYHLEKLKKLNNHFRIIGVARATWNKHDYLLIVKKSLQHFLNEKINDLIWKNLSVRFDFCNLDVTELHQFSQLKKIICNTNSLIINYFATPSNLFEPICAGLTSIQLNSMNSRIIIEKPIGNSLYTSNLINEKIGQYFQESQIFRIDHYLGKETLLNLPYLRFSNSILYNIWNKENIDHIQITLSEKVGIEGRWNYFNQTGQIRDMVQNHLLQILTIITMSQPNNLTADNIRNEKVKILKSLRYMENQNFNKNIVIGQYKHGLFNGKILPGYTQENKITECSNIETFVAIKMFIDNMQWKNVPFYVRTGKRLSKKSSKIVLVFKKPINNLFNHVAQLSNKLIIRIEPNEGFELEIFNKVPQVTHKNILFNTKFNFSYDQSFPNYKLIGAYERLLLECINGNQSLFVRRDEIEESWKWIDSIILLLKNNNIILHKYQSGSNGPSSAKDLIEVDNRFWI